MRQVTHALLTRPPLSHSSNRSNQSASLDLHVLSTPPAFILSQDQTLVKNISNWLLHQSNNQVCSGIKKTTSFLYPFYCFRFDIFMSVLNNSLFRIFRDVVYCLIIKVLCRCFLCDSDVILAHLFSLVNNFFKFIFAVFVRLVCLTRQLC